MVNAAVMATDICRPLRSVTRIINVDSRNRLDPNTSTPSTYRVNIPAVTRVRSITLATSEFTNSRFLIDATNNRIDLRTLFVNYVAVLSAGHYNVTDLQLELDRALNAALGLPPSSLFVVSYDPVTAKFTVQRTDLNTFQFLFGTGANRGAAPLEILGFAAADTALAASVTGTKAANCQGDDYALLCLNNMGDLVSSTGTSDVLAKLIWPVAARWQTFNSFISSTFVFQTPRAVLQQLEVAIVRPNGQPYDFQGVEHSFTLQVTCDE